VPGFTRDAPFSCCTLSYDTSAAGEDPGSPIRPAAHENDTVNDVAPFSSECPHCGHERMQGGYAGDELQQLLASGAEIEAYCSNCDESWFISVEERADLARLSRKR
jgi:hypothetical protein